MDALAGMLVASHAPESVCSSSGLTGAQLLSIGIRLTVDRIDPSLGYVAGNMRLMASSLNYLRRGTEPVAKEAIASLKRRASRASRR